MHVSETDRQYLEVDRDLRDKLEENSKKRKMDGPDELTATKEALLRMSSEMKQLRDEMDELRKEKGSTSAGAMEDFALGFNATEFLAMNPTKSLQWVSSTLVPRLKHEMAIHNVQFKGLVAISRTKTQSVWTCAGFNRGGNCTAKWHVHERTAKNNPTYKYKDLRLHCCTLCYDGLGILVEHPLTSCPWIIASTWTKIGEDSDLAEEK